MYNQEIKDDYSVIDTISTVIGIANRVDPLQLIIWYTVLYCNCYNIIIWLRLFLLLSYDIQRTQSTPNYTAEEEEEEEEEEDNNNTNTTKEDKQEEEEKKRWHLNLFIFISDIVILLI